MIQPIFENNQQNLEHFKKAISISRFGTYLMHSQQDDMMAVRLYHWNAQLSQSLYLYLHGWEICLRNKLNAFLAWKYNTQEWAFNDRCLRQFPAKDRAKVEETKLRQQQARKTKNVTTAAIVADLSAGIWVSLISAHTEVPFGMRGRPGDNLYRIFPNAKNITRKEYWSMCDDILALRNRVAHYEPVLHLDLEARFKDMQTIVGAICPTSRSFFDTACEFDKVFKARPVKAPAVVAA